MKCLNCNKETNNPKFCSSSCSASYNNRKRKKIEEVCKCQCCGKEFQRNRNSYGKFCSSKCVGEYTSKMKTESYLMCQKPVAIKKLRSILKCIYKNICQVCGISEWCGRPISLEVEHIDGNSQNNHFLNLTLFCHNCHSQTDTYKGKNKGNGRHFRRERYRSGKSY